ncbi:MAG: hypothetical protein IJN71_04435 [Oscillospiraceae bacterium]|nr:hypothetical protein [Oscillospiraceae bacterium]
MMKKYEAPKIEILEINVSDVITTSGFSQLFSTNVAGGDRAQRLDSFSTTIPN